MSYDAQAQGNINSRPTVRRKTSAGLLLSSFKAPGAIGGVGGGAVLASSYPQLPPTPPILSPSTSASMVMGREWDTQSQYSESTAASATAVVNSLAPGFQGTSVEYLRDMVQKRIVTLTYMRNTHEGKRHWFHTILITRGELEKVFNNVAMRKRTYRFAILAMSLSNLFDIQTPNDFLKGVLLTLSEFDTIQDENFKPKMRFFRSKPRKGQAGAINDFPSPEASETSYLVSPHIPFPLDYHQTLLSLLDILSELYQKISRILGPSPFQLNPSSSSAASFSAASMSGGHMMGPLGPLSPHPGISYIFSGSESTSEGLDAGLWSIAAGNSQAGGMLGNPSTPWTTPMGEVFVKIDGKLKKIISTLLKELDQFARNNIKDELASLDPLLRNVAVADTGREQYDFEIGM